jgi:hypothetical protein
MLIGIEWGIVKLFENETLNVLEEAVAAGFDAEWAKRRCELFFFNSLLAIRITLDSINKFAVIVYMTWRGLSNDKSSLTFS